MRRATPYLMGLLSLVLLAGSAAADGFLVPTSDRHPVRGPYAVKDHRVKIEVDGQQSRTEVRQTFRNLTREELEVHYLFPVPQGAMIGSFTLIVDGRPMEGRMLPADEARRIYEDIVRRKKDPALLTYAGRGLVKTSVFPIPAGGSREVVVRYSELLPRDGNLIRLVYPLDTERFSALPIEVVDIRVDIRSPSPIKAVYSPSHAVRLERPSESRAIASFTEEGTIPDEDLVLYYSVGEGDLGASLLTYFPPGADAGHFLLLLSPNACPDRADLIGKNIVLILDHSGSMRGEKIQQAKDALRYVLRSLGPKDRLNLVAFSSAPRALYPEVKPVTKAVLAEAEAFVNGLRAGGGTDIHGALLLGMSSIPRDPTRQNTVLFMTDGLPTIGEQNLEAIAKSVVRENRNGKDARLFTIGVGYDVNAPFLDRLVEENGGLADNVPPGRSVEITVTSMYEKISHTVLTDLVLRFTGVEVFDLHPRRMPDLFAGSQLVVAGRYKRGGSAAVILGGQTAKGKMAYRFPARFETASDPDERPFVARVWASRKVHFLIEQMRILGRREKELVDEIVRLSVRYGIVTEYTAFLADDTNDFRGFARNVAEAREELQGKLGIGIGGVGTNQAFNGRGGRANSQSRVKQIWNDAEGKKVEVFTVRNVGRKTFYQRGGAWIDNEIRADEKVHEEVRQMSARFFELVGGQSATQNRWLSFREPTLVRLNGRVVKILPAE